MKNLRKLFLLMATLALLSFSLVGCGNVNSATSSKDSTEDTAKNDDADKDTTDNMGDDLDNAADDVGDAAEDVGDAAGDLAEDAGNAVGDLIDGSKGFDNYSDAHDYFLQEMGRNDSSAKYEVRNKKEDLVSYDGENQGYRFDLYNTAENADGDHKGTYYVDSKNGKIYQKNGKGKVKEVTIAAGTKTDSSAAEGVAGADNKKGSVNE